MPVNSLSFFIKTQIGDPIHLSTSSSGRIVDAIVVLIRVPEILVYSTLLDDSMTLDWLDR